MRTPSAFSLIEVTIAIGIFAFVIVAVLGLYSLAVNSTGQSQRELVAANLSTAILNDYRRSFLDTNLGSNWTSPQFGLPSPPTSSAGVSNSLFLNESGSSSASLFSEAVYKVDYAIDTITNTAPGEKKARLHLLFTWPAAAGNPRGSYEVLTVLADRH